VDKKYFYYLQCLERPLFAGNIFPVVNRNALVKVRKSLQIQLNISIVPENQGISRQYMFLMENGRFQGKCHGREIVN